MLVHFRHRIDIGLVNRMNRSVVNNAQEKESGKEIGSESETEKKLLALEKKK